MVQKGPLYAVNLSTASGAICQKTVAKYDILLNFVTTCSDLWTIHQRKWKNSKNVVSLVAYLAMKSLLVGI
jgi:hypothetical protein